MPRVIRALHVAEKPSVAKKVAEHLSKGVQSSSRQGPSVYNRLYDFETGGPPSHEGHRVAHVVTSVTGHLMSTEFEEPYNKWHACAPRDLLCEDISSVAWTVAEDKGPLKRQLEEEARKADWLVLWLDCDREGEAIAFEVVDVCRASARAFFWSERERERAVSSRPRPRARGGARLRCGVGKKKASLELWRAKFSSVDEREVLKAWRSLGRPDKRKADAVAARCELDLRSGAAFTRFQTFRVQGKYEGVGDDGVVSYGPRGSGAEAFFFFFKGRSALDASPSSKKEGRIASAQVPVSDVGLRRRAAERDRRERPRRTSERSMEAKLPRELTPRS